MELQWPERPLCHGEVSPVFKYGNATWEQRDHTGLRHCSYCGSLHPEDLLRLLAEGKATLHGADWKYGWPHKFYVQVPEPKEGQVVEIGSRCGGDITSATEGAKFRPDCGHDNCTDHGHWYVPITGVAPATQQVKFYNDHLLDLDDQSFDAMAVALKTFGDVSFRRLPGPGGRLQYAAPHHNYQKA